MILKPRGLLKVGILQCGSVPDALKHNYIDYNQMIINNLVNTDRGISCQTWRVLDGDIPKAAWCDAWITTGSSYSVNDTSSWVTGFKDFVLEVSKTSIPFVGICFGMQMIAKALGGKVEICHKGWGIGVASSRIYRREKWMTKNMPQLNLLASHQEQVIENPVDTVLISGSEFCRNSIIMVGRNMLGFQGHPEFTKSYSRDLMKVREQCFSSDCFENGIRSLSKPVYGADIFDWIVSFIRLEKRYCINQSN